MPKALMTVATASEKAASIVKRTTTTTVMTAEIATMTAA